MIDTVKSFPLIVAKNAVKSVGVCLDLISCGASTTKIVLQGDKIGGRMAMQNAFCNQEPLSTKQEDATLV